MFAEEVGLILGLVECSMLELNQGSVQSGLVDVGNSKAVEDLDVAADLHLKWVGSSIDAAVALVYCVQYVGQKPRDSDKVVVEFDYPHLLERLLVDLTPDET
jgi:hypothetical protein